MHHRVIQRLCLAVLAALIVPAAVAQAQNPEFRALWTSRYEWPDANPAVAQANLDNLMADLAAANFNAVFLQVRGQADVLYPSPEEVWSPLIGGADPGWDPLAYAVAAAHAQGIELHAYINTHTCWQSLPASAHTAPANPDHVFYAHCNAADPDHRDWLHHDNPDNPVQFSESEYVWFAPGVPAYQAYIRRQIMHVVNNYAVDGVHWDRIRTPWSNEPSYDPISLARFNDPQSNPAGLDFTHWTADQITRTVRDIYAAIMAVRPDVKVSAAVYSNPATAPTAQSQEALVWAQTGVLDILVPMMYFSGGVGSTWDSRLQAWLAGSGGRHVVAGHITSQGNASLLEQIDLTRLRGGQGNSVFSWTSFTGWNDYLAGPYAQPASVPGMPWKDSPATAIIYGYVTDGGGDAVVDAQLVRTGDNYVALSSGDGFYSFLLVPPGTYTLSASHPAYAPAAAGGTSVSAGDVVRHDFDLGSPLPPIIAEVTPDPDSATVGTEYTRQLALVQGSSDAWTLPTGPASAVISATGAVNGWTPSSAYAGQTVSFTARAANAGGFDEESWTVQVTTLPPCDPVRITDFDDAPAGDRILFNLPRYSGSTAIDLAASPNVAVITEAVGAFSGPHAMQVEWEFVDDAPERWLRLTTHNGPAIPNPTIPFDRPIRVRLRLDSGTLRLAIGVRETGTTAELGDDGGTSGDIEWIGAAGAINDAPQGMLVEANPGVWQTFVIDPTTAPIHGMTGNGALYSPSGRGTLEHLAFTIVDGVGPFTIYLDDIDILCPLPPYGDLDGDGEVTPADYPLWWDCLAGPGVPVDAACNPADTDNDADVDLRDFAAVTAIMRSAD